MNAELHPYDLLGRSADDLRAWMAGTGEPAYRGTQLYHALYAERCFAFGAMSNLPARLRARLEAEARIALPEIARRYVSADGSVRYLFALYEATRVEAVFMPWFEREMTPEAAADKSPRRERDERHEEDGRQTDEIGARPPRPSRPVPVRGSPEQAPVRQTICISTQAGCAVDCHFCLTAQLGLIRNLTAGEIVGQVLTALADNADALAPRTNVVLMGQGEPLLNYDAVMAAVRLLLDPNGIGLAARHVTLSTSGIVPGIERLALEKVRPNLAISLNASNDEQRDVLMPINRKYPLKPLLEACRNYPLRPWEHLTFEYVLLGGVNDAPEDAHRIARLVAGLRAKVNLIPWNPGALPYRAPSPEHVEEFRGLLAGKNIPAFVRYSRGQDIAAACGQLALIENAEPSSANLPSGASNPLVSRPANPLPWAIQKKDASRRT